MVRIESYGLDPILYCVVSERTGKVLKDGFTSYGKAHIWALSQGFQVHTL